MEQYVASKDYAGFCKFDALNSPILEAVFGFSSISRLLVTQAVNRLPLPLRSVFGVRKVRNPKGVACFIKGYCRRVELTGSAEARDKAIALADWLLENDSATLGAFRGHGLAWGYPFPWQSPGFFAPRHSPNCIVSVFVGEAMLGVYRLTRDVKYLEAARGVGRFVLEDLPVLEETPYTKCIGYVPSGVRWCVVNINAVSAGFLSNLYRETGDKNLLDSARKMIQWVLSVKAPDHSWNYTHPKSQSGIGPDNYHTGGILDGIWDFIQVSCEDRWKRDYFQALEYYLANFFHEDGAPKWRANRSYPFDVHGSAQGAITFAKAALWDPKYAPVAERIVKWAVTHLWDERTGRFFYQKHRFFTWKVDLMRWNNSWMFWAMSEVELRRYFAKAEAA